jgi:L-ascorbate metabolism protein UlaG (beta-lactamase superfamily)
MTVIEWVNHASFIVRSNGTSLLCDPWLFGPAFNDGWELLVPSEHGPEVIADVDALWFSHVHPDHFAPRVLKAVSKEVRKSTPVYFQKTMDQQVAKFCRGLGFPVTEVPDGNTVEIAPGFKLTIGRVPFYDSWALVETPDARILNLNDCVLNRPRDLKRIAERIGEVDVVLTQFSYANWAGGPDEPQVRRDAADEKLEWMRTQLEALKPKACIPCASFIVFAHEENNYLNDCANSVDRAVDLVRKVGIRPVVLYPGETWEVGAEHDPQPAIDRYAKAAANRSRPWLTSDPVAWDELEHLAKGCVKRLAKRNNRALLRVAAKLGIGAPLVVKVTDLDRVARFSPIYGLTEVDASTPVDIELSSQSFAYTLKFDWGADTLSVSGRFRATPTGYRKMLRTFGPSLLNNNGRPLAFRLLADPWLVRRAFDRMILRAS